MTHSPATSEKGKFTGKHMLFIMLGFFGVILAVNITMAMFASSTWTGLVVENSYVASQHFNEQLAMAKKQKETGLKSDILYKNGQIEIEMLDKNNNPLAVENLIISLGRPSFEQQDKRLDPVSSSEGKIALPLQLEPGEWDITITGSTTLGPYRRDLRFLISGEGDGKLL